MFTVEQFDKVLIEQKTKREICSKSKLVTKPFSTRNQEQHTVTFPLLSKTWESEPTMIEARVKSLDFYERMFLKALFIEAQPPSSRLGVEQAQINPQCSGGN